MQLLYFLIAIVLLPIYYVEFVHSIFYDTDFRIMY
jgi:hypothetical protein